MSPPILAQDERLAQDQMEDLQRIMEWEREQWGQSGAMSDPAADTGLAGELKADPDIGVQRVLRRQSDHDYFSFQVRTSGQSDNNVFLTPKNEQSDMYRSNLVEVRFIPKLWGSWDRYVNANLFANYRMSNYSEYETLDFDMASAGINLNGVVSRAYSLMGYSNLSYNQMIYGSDRLLAEAGDTFERGLRLSLGMQHIRPLTRYQRATFGLGVDLENTLYVDQEDLAGETVGGQNDSEKFTYQAFTSYFYDYSYRINATAGYRFRLQDYQYLIVNDQLRQDSQHMVTLGLTYMIYEWSTLSLNYNYTRNNSNASFHEYSQSTISSGLTINLDY